MRFRPWPLAALLVLTLVSLASCSDSNSGSSHTKAQIPVTADLASGRADYEGRCLTCHGVAGNAPAPRNLIGDECILCQGAFEPLEDYIRDFMPQTDPLSCVGACAENTAAYILCEFNPTLTEGCAS
ncbi:MAG: cytochrome c [Myxococcota bacterium]|nr:cytochrome c [Myxococcota bacterium]